MHFGIAHYFCIDICKAHVSICVFLDSVEYSVDLLIDNL